MAISEPHVGTDALGMKTTAKLAGDHYLVVGRVHDLGTGTGDPLLFFRSGFGTFAP